MIGSWIPFWRQIFGGMEPVKAERTAEGPLADPQKFVSGNWLMAV